MNLETQRITKRLEQRPAGAAKPVRVALLDGDAHTHKTIRSHLAASEPKWRLDPHTHGTPAWAALRAAPPHLILLERTLPDGCGLEWLRRSKRQFPELPIIILTTQGCAETLWAALLAGAHGYWVKGGDAADLVNQLPKVLAGQMALCHQSERLLPQAFAMMQPRTVNQWGLSWREDEVMAALCARQTEKEIGLGLGIETGTVHAHLVRIYKKMAVHDRASAIQNYLPAIFFLCVG